MTAVVFRENRASLRSFLGAGFKIVAEIWALRLGPLRLKRVRRRGDSEDKGPI